MTVLIDANAPISNENAKMRAGNYVGRFVNRNLFFASIDAIPQS